MRDHSFLEPTDAARTASAIETFSNIPFNQAREIMQLMHQLYFNFSALSARERDSVFAMVTTMYSITPTRRTPVFNAAKQFIMPYEYSRDRDPKACFHDINDNSSLITLFTQEENLTELSTKLQEAFQYLTNDQLPNLYGENKLFFIKVLKNIPATGRVNFLTQVLPLLASISQKHWENWMLSATAEKLAAIYERPHFSIRINYLIRQLQNDNFSSFESIDTMLRFSEAYAEKQAAKLTTKTFS